MQQRASCTRAFSPLKVVEMAYQVNELPQIFLKTLEFLTALFLLVMELLSLTQSHHKPINPNEFAYFVQDKQCVGFFSCIHFA